MNQTTVFPLSPNINRARGSTDTVTASLALKELAAHFGVDVPKLRISRGRGACYVPSRKTIRWGRNSFRGIDALLHEFAHHMQKEPQYTEMKPEGRTLRPSWYSGKARKARSIHGPDFFAALLAVATFAYGSAKHFSWANEYKSIASKYKRTYGESHNVNPTWDKSQGLTVSPPSALPLNIVLGRLVRSPRAIAAAPVGAPKSGARRAQANAAWAPPNEANDWTGGCLWRKFKGNK
jgi:hypothetical protein